MNTEPAFIARVLKALSNDRRRMILSFLQSGEKTVGDIVQNLHIAQSTLWHHLKVLLKIGLVTTRKEDLKMHYSINVEESEKVASLMRQFIMTATDESDTK